MTVAQAHSQAVAALKAAGFDHHEAAITARLLVDKSAGVPYAYLSRPDHQLPEYPVFIEDLERLCDGYPLAYLLGKREFYGLTFRCDERALIPRADTETLVEAAIDRLKGHPTPLVADLGTGTGCIAISVAHSLPQAVAHATDASPAALSLARENAAVLEVAGRVKFFEGQVGGWALPLAHFAGGYQAILTNPPYISIEDIKALQPQIREHEPLSALDGGEDGLDCYREIAAQCRPLLAPGGFLMAELGAGQFAAVSDIFSRQGWLVEPPLLDLARIERVLVATWPRTV